VVLFDNNVLCLLLHPEADIPNDPDTGKPVTRGKDRISFLIETLRESGTRILIPTPVLSEFLTVADTKYLDEINHSIWFEVGPFDQRAAIEAGLALKRDLANGKGKTFGLDSNWQRVKVDRQIVAIGKVYEVSAVYTTDRGLATAARENGLKSLHPAALPLPPSDRQPLPLIDLREPTEVSSSEPEPPSEHSPDAEKE
jgi:predicted nucleic acid-binding protein